MKKALDTEDQRISPELSNDFQKQFSESDNSQFLPFTNLFQQEQQKYINSSTTIRYYPIILKFCLNLAAKLSSVLKDLCFDSTTVSDLLVFASSRTLRDYKNYIKSTREFNPDVVNNLGKQTANFSRIERYVTILLDEMEIQC